MAAVKDPPRPTCAWGTWTYQASRWKAGHRSSGEHASGSVLEPIRWRPTRSGCVLIGAAAWKADTHCERAGHQRLALWLMLSDKSVRQLPSAEISCRRGDRPAPSYFSRRVRPGTVSTRIVWIGPGSRSLLVSPNGPLRPNPAVVRAGREDRKKREPASHPWSALSVSGRSK